MEKVRRNSQFIFFIFCLAVSTCLIGRARDPANRFPSYPYITGDGFRAYCDFVFDETNPCFQPKNIRNGNTIFVKTEYLQYFFTQFHKLIHAKYIIVSHNSDLPAPGFGLEYLNDEKLIAWFAQNVDVSHPKLIPIPIGIENRYCSHGPLPGIDPAEGFEIDKTDLLYMNFSLSTCPPERGRAFELFKDQPFCKVSFPKAYNLFLEEAAHSKFVLSPRGNGWDCHRTWEALYIGSIPIVKTSACNPMFDGLPVVIVNVCSALFQF